MQEYLGLKTYLSLFRGREGYFAQQRDDSYDPVNKQFDEFYLKRHLAGDTTFGIYLLTEQSTCNLVCVDIDILKAELDELEFRDLDTKFERLSEQLYRTLAVLTDLMHIPSSSLLLEETGGRGYHIWVLLAAALSGNSAVAFGDALKSKLDFEIEFFPKQGTLTEKRKLGNLIKLPLGVHKKYGRRSVFFELSDRAPCYLGDVQDNLAFLENVLPVDPAVLRDAAGNGDLVQTIHRPAGRGELEVGRAMYEGPVDRLFSGCTAIRQIRDKAAAGQVLSYSEAFHFANTMLSVPDGEGAVYRVIRSAFGDRYDPDLCQSELERIKPLHPTSCRTLVNDRICPAYCKASVAERNRDPLLSNTSPCSVWLRPKRSLQTTEIRNTVDAISNPDAIQRAFYRLKQYHEHEDSLFYDPFDFEVFETDLGARARLLAHALHEKIDIPFAGYLLVSIPKKLDSELRLQFRQMAYSTVYDQVPIQTLFDAIAPAIEAKLQSCSYGYRWNLNADDPSRIFEDWREAYPRFRRYILSAIQNHPLGYHISCDIKGYYDHVDHGILLEQLRTLDGDDYVYHFLQRIVRLYKTDPTANSGIPQGPAYARILANLYLDGFDTSAQRASVSYCRYVDDFFLVFDSYESAERGLEAIVVALDELGLELSDDEKRRAVIRQNTDISDIRRALDQIQYGILEGTRQLQHLDQETVEYFYDLIERHGGSPSNIEQLLRINDALPSLLYTMSQKSTIEHPFRRKLFKICELLISHNWFFPKRLKIIFYRLLQIQSEDHELEDLFERMTSAHKTYFLLSVFGSWRSTGAHVDLLKALLKKASKSDDPFVLGFALSIGVHVDEPEVLQIGRDSLFRLHACESSWFPLARLLSSNDYSCLRDGERESIRDLVSNSAPEFVKAVLLERLKGLPPTFAEGLFVCGLMGEFLFVLVLGVINLMVEAQDRNQVFDCMVTFLSSTASFKSLCISLVTKKLRERCMGFGQAKIGNLRSLYECIPDGELKRELINVLVVSGAHAMDAGTGFARTLERVERYNGCYLFEKPRDVAGNLSEYLEQVSEDELLVLTGSNLDTTKQMLRNWASLSIIPSHEFQYDSQRHEVTLRFFVEEKCIERSRGDFALTPADIAMGLRLADNIFKKAVFFKHQTGKPPAISLSNLLFGQNRDFVVFRTIGRSFASPLVISGIKIGQESADIARMIGLLLQQLFFKTDAEATEFLGRERNGPASAFLSHVIRTMLSKDPSRRYSRERFHSIAGALSRSQSRSADHMTVLYLVERLRAKLFSETPIRTSWQGICHAVNRHVSDIHTLFDKGTLSRVQLQKRGFEHRRALRSIHYISREIINLCMNRDRLPQANFVASEYLDFVEYLLYFNVLCVEVVSFCREIWSDQPLSASNVQSLLMAKSVSVSAAKYKRVFAGADIAALSTYRQDGTGTDMRDLSLDQMALLALLACGNEWDGTQLRIVQPSGLTRELFDDLSLVCLIRVPRIEAEVRKCVQTVTETLRMGEEFSATPNIPRMYKTLESIVVDLARVRRGLSLRRYSGWVDGRKFPEKLLCKSFLHKRLESNAYAIPEIALANNVPSTRLRGSWGVRNGSVTNLIVPSFALHGFLSDLKAGDIFKRIKYAYSGRRMLLIDGPLFICLLTIWAVLQILGTNSHNNVWSAICAIGIEIFKRSAEITGLKVAYDLTRWSRAFGRLIAYIKKGLTVDVDETDNDDVDSS